MTISSHKGLSSTCKVYPCPMQFEIQAVASYILLHQGHQKEKHSLHQTIVTANSDWQLKRGAHKWNSSSQLEQTSPSNQFHKSEYIL